MLRIEDETHNQTTHCGLNSLSFLQDSGLWNPLIFLPFPLSSCSCVISLWLLNLQECRRLGYWTPQRPPAPHFHIPERVTMQLKAHLKKNKVLSITGSRRITFKCIFHTIKCVLTKHNKLKSSVITVLVKQLVFQYYAPKKSMLGKMDSVSTVKGHNYFSAA